MRTSRQAFLISIFLLAGVGAMMVLSASVTSRPSQLDRLYFFRHLISLSIAAVCGTAAAMLPARAWKQLAPWAFAGTLGLLVLVLIPGVGTEVNGARRWLRLGPVSLQPSEIAKVALPLYLCWVIERRRQRRNGAAAPEERTIPPLIPIAVTAFLVLQEPDLGTSVFLCCGAFLCLFLAGLSARHFLFAGGLVVPVAAGMVALRPYQIERMQGFLAAWSDFRDAPYQMRQSLATLAAGGLSGEGLGRGWQKLSFLPEANTDFVFAVIGEELGLIGTLGIVVLWVSVFGSGVRMLSMLPRRSFEYVAALTLLTQLVMQAAANAAIVTALLPPKGMPHPLISYGGSSLLMSLVSVGIVVSLSRGGETALPEFRPVDETPATQPPPRTDPPPRKRRRKRPQSEVGAGA